MGNGHSLDLRRRIIAAVRAGASAREAARRFDVSPSSAITLARRWRRRNWQIWLKPDRLVFIDETGTKTNMARRRGRSQSGQRPHGAVPRGHWKTTTLVAVLRIDGLSAPMVLDGAMNGAAFKAYVEQVLVPSSRPGDIVVMDNLSSHKVEGLRKAIKAAGAILLYPPPYPPTSTQSNRPSPSSRPSCERPPPEPSTTSGGPVPTPSTSSMPKNAPTSSKTPIMRLINLEPL